MFTNKHLPAIKSNNESIKLRKDLDTAAQRNNALESKLNEVTKAVRRTNEWFIRCKNYLKDNPRLYEHSQTLFPIIQGGINHKMREMSIEGLVPHADFGIAIGGLAVGEEKNAMFDTIEFCDSLLPKNRHPPPTSEGGSGRPLRRLSHFKTQ